MTSINSLTESLTELARGGIGVAQHVANINNLAHELLGQGGIFDYPLMTGIGKSLYMATMDPDMDISENKLKLFSPCRHHPRRAHEQNQRRRRIGWTRPAERDRNGDQTVSVDRMEPG